MDFEWDDPQAWAFAGVVTLVMVLFVFKDPMNLGWRALPLTMRLPMVLLTPPVIYWVAFKQLNKGG